MQASILHKEFWNELREEHPSLMKLNLIGNKINNTVKEAKDHFNQIQKLNSNVHEMLQTFAKFLANILNEKDVAQPLYERAKRIKLDKKIS